MRQDDLELTEQLTSLYNGLSHLRQTLTNRQFDSSRDISVVPIHIDSSMSTHYHSKKRSVSEPNILIDRQCIITIIDDLN